ncbi:ATP-binding protein [Glycomyces sp. NPDC021274]|uniref:sensor histidine kinase n=1 Tax=Glycomyces sp. NPDC021274 TaxID=3155120 RepID=UPI0034102104
MPETSRTTTQTYHPEAPHAPDSGGPDLKARLLRLGLLPFCAAVVAGAGVAVFLSQGESDLAPVVYASAAVLLLIVGYLTLMSATKIDADLGRRIGSVRRSTVETHYKVWQALDDLQRNRPIEQRWSVPLPSGGEIAATTDEAISQLAAETRHLRAAAEAIVARGITAAPVQQPRMVAPPPQRPAVAPPPPPPAPAALAAHAKVGIFVSLARRIQPLVHKEIIELDHLEKQVEDPDLLKGLFLVDHLATRIRRHAENLAVLGGATPHRQWSRPINVYEILRSAVSEVDQYHRVKLVLPIKGTVQGHAVADLIHLVAELVENATVFSDPNTTVLMRVSRVRTGLAVEVEDRGLGVEQSERDKYNRMLADPENTDLAALLDDGRIGLYVVASLAHQHHLTVQLQGNIYGGTQAVMIIPEELLGDVPKPAEPAAIAAAPEPKPPVVQMRALPTAGTGHHTGALPAPRMDPVPAKTDALPVTEEMPVLDEPRPLNGERPDLPKRRKQSHLAPQLRDTTPRNGHRAPDAGHDPGLMKAFQQGQHRAGGYDEAPIPTSEHQATNEES